MRALHHFEGFRASRETPRWGATRVWGLKMEPFQDAHADQSDEDQIDRDNVVEQPRHDQDQDACDQSDDGRQMRCGDVH